MLKLTPRARGTSQALTPSPGALSPPPRAQRGGEAGAWLPVLLTQLAFPFAQPAGEAAGAGRDQAEEMRGRGGHSAS